MKQLPTSVVRETRTLRSVGAGGGRLPLATRWVLGNQHPYRDRPLRRVATSRAEVFTAASARDTRSVFSSAMDRFRSNS